MKLFTLLFIGLTLSLNTANAASKKSADPCEGKLTSTADIERLRAIYSGEMPAGAGLRERQKIVTELQADLDTSHQAFDSDMPGEVNLYYFGRGLKLEKPEEQIRHTLDLFSNAIQRERREMHDQGMAWSVLGAKKAVVSRSLLAVFFAKEAPHTLRVQLAVLLFKLDYQTDLGQRLLEWALARTKNEMWAAQLLPEAISEHRRLDEEIRKEYRDRYFSGGSSGARSSARDDASSARSVLRFVLPLLPHFKDPKAFAYVLGIALRNFASSEVSEYERSTYLVLRQLSGPNELKAKIMQAGIAQYGSLPQFLDGLKNVGTDAKILALKDWDQILSDSVKAKFKNPEFEMVIFGLFAQGSDTHLSGMLNKASKEILERLAGLVKTAKLFDHDPVLALAEKYPAFEKWAEEQLKIP